MFKKLLVICAPVIVFFVFLTVFILFSGSKPPDKASETSDTTAFEKETSSDFGENESAPAETTERKTEIDFTKIDMVYDAPCTPEEIRSIFKEDKVLFEKIKDIKMPKGYNYLYAVKTNNSNSPYRIEFYGFDGLGNVKSLSYDIGETGDYSEIYEFFKKYGYINFIHTIDPESAEYAGENLIAQFGFEIDVPVSSNHVAWAEIRYNRVAGEIEETATNEYMTVPLDDNWYYMYCNI